MRSLSIWCSCIGFHNPLTPFLPMPPTVSELALSSSTLTPDRYTYIPNSMVPTPLSIYHFIPLMSISSILLLKTPKFELLLSSRFYVRSICFISETMGCLEPFTTFGILHDSALMAGTFGFCKNSMVGASGPRKERGFTGDRCVEVPYWSCRRGVCLRSWKFCFWVSQLWSVVQV